MMECLIEAERLFICDFPNAPFAWNLSTDWGLEVKAPDFFVYLQQVEGEKFVKMAFFKKLFKKKEIL